MERLATILKWTGIAEISVMMAVAVAVFFGAEIPYLFFEVGLGLVFATGIGYAVAWSLEKPPTEAK